MVARRLTPPKGVPHDEYHKLWRVVDGAVRDCFYHHPDYLTEKGGIQARESIVKRVTGALVHRFDGSPEMGKADPEQSGG